MTPYLALEDYTWFPRNRGLRYNRFHTIALFNPMRTEPERRQFLRSVPRPGEEKMTSARWRLRSVLILIAGLSVLCASASKWRQYAELRKRIAGYSREEKLLLAEYQQSSRLIKPCGNERRRAAAFLSLAAERRHEIESCEREIRRIW